MGLNVTFANLSNTTSFFSGEYNVTSVIITICCALSLNNALELLLLIFTTFKRFRGLYFWSLLVASSGVIPYTIGFMIEYFKLTVQAAGLIITCVGWPMMVTGQSLVLYSRLHVVFGKTYGKLLKGVKWMIIIDAFVFHISTILVLWGAYYGSPGLGFAAAYRSIEKIQMTGFTVQEFILSGLYVWKTLEVLRATSQRKRTSRIMWQLFSINVLIVLMDIALLVVEYQNRHVIEQAIKQVIYSIKLKLEFAILSKLAGLAKDANGGFTATFEDYDDLLTTQHDAAPIGQRNDSMTIRQTSSVSPCARASSGRTDSIMAAKQDAAHIENGFDFADVLSVPSVDDRLARHWHLSEATTTADDRRRRRTLEEDLYSGVLRDVNG